MFFIDTDVIYTARNVVFCCVWLGGVVRDDG